jgi:hypothetical protein
LSAISDTQIEQADANAHDAFAIRYRVL